MKKRIKLITAVLVAAFLGIVSGVAFVIALGISTLRLIGLAMYEILIEDWKDREVERTDVRPYPTKPTPRQIETERLRREQRLIQKFKMKV